MGSVRKNELLCSFKTIKAIKNAGLDELSAVVPKNTAKTVLNIIIRTRKRNENNKRNKAWKEAQRAG